MDEEQISTLRATLHNWINQASVEQLERMNQVIAIDAWIPVEMPREEQPYFEGDITPYPSQRNIDNERRRKRADWLAQREYLKSMKATPEQMAEWEATNPEPLHDADLMICSTCGVQISRISENCPVCGEKT